MIVENLLILKLIYVRVLSPTFTFLIKFRWSNLKIYKAWKYRDGVKKLLMKC